MSHASWPQAAVSSDHLPLSLFTLLFLRIDMIVHEIVHEIVHDAKPNGLFNSDDNMTSFRMTSFRNLVRTSYSHTIIRDH